MLDRRNFAKRLLSSATLVSATPALPRFLLNSAAAAARQPASRDTVLVVVQLAGGNDGLNTVVPFDDDEYGRHRSTLRLKASEVLPLDSYLGLHPSMDGLWRLAKEGTLALVQGVGYPNPDYSHPGSMRVWHTAQVDRLPRQTGWVGRAADAAVVPGSVPVPAVYVGEILRPLAVESRLVPVPGLRSASQWVFSQSPVRPRETEWPVSATSRNNLLDYVDRATLAAMASSQRVAEAIQWRRSSPAAAYPTLPLAQRLQEIANLIRADLGVRIFYTEMGGNEPGGFDTHAGQRDNHAALLRELSASLTAFADDLKRQGLLGRVRLLTFSEFGRTLAENGRRGTGHGAAQPVLLMGGNVAGGVIGKNPDLSRLDGEGGVVHHTDFRRLFATLLDRWLDIDSQKALGGSFEPLDWL